jgi:hypothetical protein
MITPAPPKKTLYLLAWKNLRTAEQIIMKFDNGSSTRIWLSIPVLIKT